MTPSRHRAHPSTPSASRCPPAGGWRCRGDRRRPTPYVAERARAGEAPGLVLVAEHQTAGRGRLDRAWETPARAALTFSVLLRPRRAGAVVAVAAAAHRVRRRRRRCADRLPDVALKWPNDVLVERARKVCGHPRRAGRDRPTAPVAVVGIGINVVQTLDELPVALATSVSLETGEPVERTGLLGQVLGSLHGLQGLLDDVESLRRAYADVCVTLGRTVDVHLPAGDVRRGEALDIDATGAAGRRHRRGHVHGRRGRRRARPSRLAARDTG